MTHSASKKPILLSLFAISMTLAGCNIEKAMVTISYTLEPSKGLPAGLTTVAIMPAELGEATDPKWSDISSDMLTKAIESSRDEYGVALRVADRAETRKVFDESDLAASGLTDGGASSQAQLLGVQGFVVSKINIKETIDRGTATTISGFSFDGGGTNNAGGGGFDVDTREVEKVKKTVAVQAVFKLVDARTAETWTIHEESDLNVEETSPGIFFGSGEGEAGLVPTDQIAEQVIRRGITNFVNKLVPCTVSYEVKVKSDDTPTCAAGVQLLRGDMFAEALDSFKQAIAEDPEDHRAYFGAGVACEALGETEEALQFYRRANAVKDKDEYQAAKERLDRDLPRIRPGSVRCTSETD